MVGNNVKIKIMAQQNKENVLITGASSGIGLCYAEELARQGHSMMLVSNQAKELEEVGARLAQTYGVEVKTLYKDLSAKCAAEEVHQYCKEIGFQVDILINNAGVFFFNDYHETSMERIELMLDLHVKTVSKMCRLFGEDMRERRFGYILNMSSMSAWMSFPGISVYNATKAYILNFSRSLWYELKPYNVGVTAICPGAVDTGLYGLSDYWRKVAVRIGVSMKPETLVKKALRKMFKKKKQYIPGWINKPFVGLMKHLPDWFILFVIKKIKKFQK